VPSQRPESAVSVWPSIAMPEIVGGSTFEGGTAAMRSVALAIADVLSARFVAVTTRRIVASRSLVPITYVERVAPGISSHVSSERSHW
jgi:hypothetical protein